MTRIQWSLVAHTNVGKTTLARTLLRRDVGQVLDHAHVTEEGERHVLLETGEDELILWDTPGFGDSARLARRLAGEGGSSIARFLGQAWDRVADRPLWCSQEALRNVREEADVVLYLVNAAEHPEDAGYLKHELTILQWLERPVLCLLNQTGGEQTSRATEADPRQRWLEAWREELAGWSCVGGVLELDAFTRSWREEQQLFSEVTRLLHGEQHEAMERLGAAWKERGESTYRASLEAMASHLLNLASDAEPLTSRLAGRAEKQRAVEALSERAAASERELWERLIELHGLEGRASVELRRELSDCLVHGQDELDERRNALVGGAISGALGGLTADAMSGGLSFGGGLLAGGLLGALGGAGLTRGIRLLRRGEQPAVTWSHERLDLAIRDCCVTYASVAHFGRGRGRLETESRPQVWNERVEELWTAAEQGHARPWDLAARQSEEAWAQRDVKSKLRALMLELCEPLLAR